jgi:hypothetical protein
MIFFKQIYFNNPLFIFNKIWIQIKPNKLILESTKEKS